MASNKESVQTTPFLRPPNRVRQRPWLAVSAIFLTVLVLFQSVRPFISAQQHGCSHDPHPPQLHLTYPGENLVWTPCGDVEGRPLECSTLTVPMDQFTTHPDDDDETFVLPLIRERGRDKGPLPNLFLNPGGPGGSGISFMHRRGAQLRDIVGEGVHLLSFDPRGVGDSEPAATCYGDEESRRQHAVVRASRVVDGVVDDSAEAYAWAHNYVRACADIMGPHGRYINTPQTAADMNSILDAVGQDGLVYWGFSYGTLLGQTYAELFPERAHRVIIDGVANEVDWYEGLLDAEAHLDSENVWRGFLLACVHAGPKNCALAALVADEKSDGRAVAQLQAEFDDLAAQLRQDPLSVYVNASVYGLLTYETIWYRAIFPALYRPAEWRRLAAVLTPLLADNNGTAALLAYGLDAPWDEGDGDATAFVMFNDGAAGLRYWPQQDRQELLDVVMPYMNTSVFAPTDNRVYYIKQQWQVPRTHGYVPRDYDEDGPVHTAHPLLLLSTTFDPICPLQSARAAQAAFADSQIIEVIGYGHCSIAVPSVCAARHIRAFLYNGTVPTKYTQCLGDGPFFGQTEEVAEYGSGMVLLAQKQFDDPEDQRIHMAQLRLAQGKL